MEKKPLRKKKLNKRIRLNILQSTITNTFPDENDYFDSIWDIFEKYIKEGNKKEEEVISKYIKKCQSKGDDNLIEYAGEDFDKLNDVSHIMYASLIVSIWSKIEYLLKRCLKVSFIIQRRKTKVLEKTQDFCAVSLKETMNKEELGDCIKELKKLKDDVPFKFDDIKKTYKDDLKIDLKTLQDFSTIDAIRILNNSFKHSSGYYKPDKKQHTQIDKTLLKRWELKTKKKIDYSSLPINELVFSCNAFCNDLLEEIKTKLL